MRIRVHPADFGGSGHYRLLFPAQALAAQGADVHIDTVGPRVYWDRRWTGEHPPLDAVVLGCDKPDADVVVIQRPGRAHWANLIPHLQRHGTRVVVDVDDDFAAIPRGNVANRHYDPQLSPHHNSDWITRACELADLVTVSTPALANRYGRHGRVAVLPNLVPASYLTVTSDRMPGVTIGWSGNVATHPHDLEVTGGGVHRAVQATGARFHVIGTGEGVAERLGCTVDCATGWVDFDSYPQAVAGLDVGIVPLHDSPFNRAKSALKASEYAALGAVPVMSPTPDNQRLHALGVGVLADRPQQWKKHLVRLATNEQTRAEMASRGREAMAAQTYEARCDQWHDVWTAATQPEAVAS